VGDATQRIFTPGTHSGRWGSKCRGEVSYRGRTTEITAKILDAAFPLVSSEWLADVEEATKAGIETEPVFSSRNRQTA